MRLDGLLEEAEHIVGYEEALELARSTTEFPTQSRILSPPTNVPTRTTVPRITVIDAAKPYLLACLQRDLKPQILLIASSGQRANHMAEQFQVWSGASALLYDEADTLFYEHALPDVDALGKQLRVLATLSGGFAPASPILIVASVRALMNKIMAPSRFIEVTRRVNVGDLLDMNQFLNALLRSGYRPEHVVEVPGSFARRGGIIDIFSPTGVNPVRLELFDNEIETIREFDATTQRSGAQLTSALISPVRPAACDSPNLVRALSSIDLAALRPEVAEQWRRDLEEIKEHGTSDKSGYYEAACCDSTLLDYLPHDALVIVDEPDSVWTAMHELDAQAGKVRGELAELGELPRAWPSAYLTRDELESALLRKERIEIGWQGAGLSTEDNNLDVTSPQPNCLARSRLRSPLPATDAPEPGAVPGWGVAAEPGYASPRVELGFRGVPSYGGKIKMLANDVARMLGDVGRVMVVSHQAKRLLELLHERDIPASLVSDLSAASPDACVTLLQGELHEGFELVSVDRGRGVVLLTDAELFGWSKPRRAAPKKTASRDLFISDLEIGSYVVHVEHGIGRFDGLVHLADDGVEREYMVIQYSEGDRLYVPVDQLDRVSRYVGVGEHGPRLHRLGTGDWARLKERVKAATHDIAKDLLEVYAAREAKPGFAYSTDTPWQRELEDSFPYVETSDQLRAIAETKADMEKPKPMDRLICGDVGYGKTEVALRAAFKAVMDGKQVAILVPTTVLAQQHFDTFRERMQAFPVRVEMLSRFRTEKEQHVILDGLRSGTVDICIGTHRLVQKDVQFKELGLVIIDEEQRFGVAHKERLKQLRKEVDVLTLTATPIPRTLYLAISGVRDMSTMETPPDERLPIKTFVTEYDPRLVRDAILRELDRGGQVYYVHNRVQSIGLAAQRLAELVPEALIEIGHGQMPEDRLEKVMVDFAAGKFDVLVCTTIIESGLDIPNVNTLIVNNADRFGLAQLYQLRGRVGRGAHRAYACFLFSKGKQLTPTAEKRLRTIFEATDLGAGFRIAMRDLEIRGAGNLLGAEQHGHVAAVGFDLYCRLLAEAVKELQGKAEAPRPEVVLSLPVAAYLPDSYVTDQPLRINLYQRMANARALEEVGNLVLEMRERFGPLPEPVLNLAFLLQLKITAGNAGVARIETVEDEIVITLADGVPVRRDDLLREFGPMLKVGRSQLRLSLKVPNGNWLGLTGHLIERLADN